jgi:hypothetical protein
VLLGERQGQCCETRAARPRAAVDEPRCTGECDTPRQDGQLTGSRLTLYRQLLGSHPGMAFARDYDEGSRWRTSLLGRGGGRACRKSVTRREPPAEATTGWPRWRAASFSGLLRATVGGWSERLNYKGGRDLGLMQNRRPGTAGPHSAAHCWCGRRCGGAGAQGGG